MPERSWRSGKRGRANDQLRAGRRHARGSTGPSGQKGTDVRMWIDTEFNEYRGELISLALVSEDGREWYGVRFCDAPGWWVREHVMPHLNQEPRRDAELR